MAKNTHTTVKVSEIPNCDFCLADHVTKKAYADGRTVYGYWANMCHSHFSQLGVGLGLGKGQAYVKA
jgi:hypothetical protein